MHYLLTDRPSHRDRAHSSELPAVTGDDGEFGDPPSFIRDGGVEVKGVGGLGGVGAVVSRMKSMLKCWVDLHYGVNGWKWWGSALLMA